VNLDSAKKALEAQTEEAKRRGEYAKRLKQAQGSERQLIGGDTKSTLTARSLSEMGNVIVDVTYSNGSTTRVLLRKQGVGYVGPKGEYYDHLPTDEELKPVYGH